MKTVYKDRHNLLLGLLIAIVFAFGCHQFNKPKQNKSHNTIVSSLLAQKTYYQSCANGNYLIDIQNCDASIIANYTITNSIGTNFNSAASLNGNTLTVDARNLPPGLYTFTLISSNQKCPLEEFEIDINDNCNVDPNCVALCKDISIDGDVSINLENLEALTQANYNQLQQIIDLFPIATDFKIICDENGNRHVVTLSSDGSFTTQPISILNN